MNKKIKKKIHLTKLSKICLTMIIICMCPLIYHKVTLYGESVMTSNISLTLVAFGWVWLLFGQTYTLSFIWEK